jgi:hypothetical protein
MLNCPGRFAFRRARFCPTHIEVAPKDGAKGILSIDLAPQRVKGCLVPNSVVAGEDDRRNHRNPSRSWCAQSAENGLLGVRRYEFNPFLWDRFQAMRRAFRYIGRAVNGLLQQERARRHAVCGVRLLHAISRNRVPQLFRWLARIHGSEAIGNGLRWWWLYSCLIVSRRSATR